MRQLRGWSEHEFISLCLHRVSFSWMTHILFNKTFLCDFAKRFLQPVVVFSLSLKNLAFFPFKCSTFDFVSVHHLFAFSCDSMTPSVKAQCSWTGCVCSCRFKRKMVAEIKCFSAESPVPRVYVLLESTLLSRDFLQGKIISFEVNLDPGPCGGNTQSSY